MHAQPAEAEDLFHGDVAPGKGFDTFWHIGVHRAVGYYDLPNAGDILSAALASCLDSTLRMIADRYAIPIAFLKVAVHAETDVRGTLVVDRGVPVGFQRMQCNFRLEPADETGPTKLEMRLAATEHSCVVLQTLRNGVPVRTCLNHDEAWQGAAAECRAGTV